LEDERGRERPQEEEEGLAKKEGDLTHELGRRNEFEKEIEVERED